MCVCVCVCVCVYDIFIMYTLSHENIWRVNAIKYFEVDGHKIQRNSPAETIVLSESPLKALECVLNFHRHGDVYLIHFQTFLLLFC